MSLLSCRAAAISKRGGLSSGIEQQLCMQKALGSIPASPGRAGKRAPSENPKLTFKKSDLFLHFAEVCTTPATWTINALSSPDSMCTAALKLSPWSLPPYGHCLPCRSILFCSSVQHEHRKLPTYQPGCGSVLLLTTHTISGSPGLHTGLCPCPTLRCRNGTWDFLHA